MRHKSNKIGNDDGYSPLVQFVLSGLEKCWMPADGCFSHIYYLHPTSYGNISKPESDVFYTLNVLLGFSKLYDRGASLLYDIPEIYNKTASKLPSLPVPAYAYGMALWTAAELELAPPSGVISVVRKWFDDKNLWKTWTGQDLGMLLSGVVAQAKNEPKDWIPYSHRLKAHLDRHYSCEKSGLFYNSPRSYRRRFASFATGMYLTLACFHYGEFFEHELSIRRGLKCAESLGRCQGPQGEWPWFYDVPSGKVVDFYPVFSVHQDGMAPAYLHHAIAHGMIGAKDSLVRGFKWILGDNQLNLSMIDAEHGMILRAQARNEKMERGRRAIRSVMNCVSFNCGIQIDPNKIKVIEECRSYHLGWVLWAFAGQSDFSDLTDMDCFQLEKNR